MIGKLFSLALAMLCLVGSAVAQQQITFRFERPTPGVLVPRYSFELHEDGTVAYHAEIVTAGAQAMQTVEKNLTLAPVTVRQAFEAVVALHDSDKPCASRLKNIADTGAKTVISRGPQGETTCSFNYTENKGAAQLTELFQGIELTLEAGRALDFKRRFDRLGLDAEMANLNTQVEEGRAQGLETIASTLRSIAADPDLIERVRLRAGKLLDRVGAVAAKTP